LSNPQHPKTVFGGRVRQLTAVLIAFQQPSITQKRSVVD